MYLKTKATEYVTVSVLMMGLESFSVIKAVYARLSQNLSQNNVSVKTD